MREQIATARAKGDNDAARKVWDEANASYREEKAQALWKTLRRHGTWVVPTLVAMQSTANRRELARENLAELNFVPPSLRARWAPNEIEKEFSPEIATWYRAQFENDLKLARSMHRGGVQMLAGSDSLDPFNFPGPSLHEELKLLTEAGLTPADALQAATSKPAEFLDAKDCGEIRPGAIADLVLLDANPLDNIANTRKISAVVVRGKFLSHEQLEQILTKARATAKESR